MNKGGKGISVFKLTISLIAIPRLFASLFLLPLVLGVTLVGIQTGFSLLAVKTTERPEKKEVKKQVANAEKDDYPIRRLLLGNSDYLKHLQICDWRPYTGVIDEELPGEFQNKCAVYQYDVVINSIVISKIPTETFESFFKGNFRAIHICDDCKSDIRITYKDNKAIATEIHSLPAYILLAMTTSPGRRSEEFNASRKNIDLLDRLTGSIYFYAHGFKRPADTGDLAKSIVLLTNIAFLILGALWLSLKSHRKVLDYFSDNAVLLPLVASCGKNVFYSSIWVLTVLRVLFFLTASIPIVWLSIRQIIKGKLGDLLYYGDIFSFSGWLTCNVCSLAVAVLIGSIAELQHRKLLVSLFYRFVPFFVALFGGIVWGISFFYVGEASGVVRNIIASLPLLGTLPLLVAPVLPPPEIVLICNLLLNVALITILLRANSRWFAAHLEEL
jgi:hypothetical protein